MINLVEALDMGNGLTFIQYMAAYLMLILLVLFVLVVCILFISYELPSNGVIRFFSVIIISYFMLNYYLTKTTKESR